MRIPIIRIVVFGGLSVFRVRGLVFRVCFMSRVQGLCLRLSFLGFVCFEFRFPWNM